MFDMLKGNYALIFSLALLDTEGKPVEVVEFPCQFCVLSFVFSCYITLSYLSPDGTFFLVRFFPAVSYPSSSVYFHTGFGEGDTIVREVGSHRDIEESRPPPLPLALPCPAPYLLLCPATPTLTAECLHPHHRSPWRHESEVAEGAVPSSSAVSRAMTTQRSPTGCVRTLPCRPWSRRCPCPPTTSWTPCSPSWWYVL